MLWRGCIYLFEGICNRVQQVRESRLAAAGERNRTVFEERDLLNGQRNATEALVRESVKLQETTDQAIVRLGLAGKELDRFLEVRDLVPAEVQAECDAVASCAIAQRQKIHSMREITRIHRTASAAPGAL